MSNTSFMEKLLDGVEVEWKVLGDIGEFIRGNGMQKKDFVDDGFPAIHYGQIYTKYGLAAKKTFTYVSKELASKLRIANNNDLLIATTSENDEDVVKPLAWFGRQAAISGDMMLFRHNQNVKYLAYFFQTEVFQAQKRKYISGTKVRRVSKDNLAKIAIPLPPLDIQAEIVCILDTFTALTTELTAELTARKEQYNYYRERLILNSNSNLEKLENISKIYLGLTYTPIYVNDGIKFISAQNTSSDFLNLTNVKYISEDEYNRSTSNAKPKKGDILFTRVGSNLGHPVIIETDEKLCIFVSLGFIRVDPEKVINSYIKHWMNTDLFWAQVRKNVHGSAKVNLNTGWLKKFDVLLPSLEEQARIVTILDKFDTLTTSISEGLPHEIALRQKQYEYYRDLLLSFPKPDITKEV